MRRTTAHLTSLVATPSGRPAVRLRTVPGALAVPGQVSLACRPGAVDPLRQMLIPVELHPDGFTCLLPEATRWLPGDELDLLGPLGRGFRPPAAGSRWVLAAIGLPFEALLPLMQVGLQRGAEMAIWTEQPLPLPPEVEILHQLEPALAWADYLALAASIGGLARLQSEAALAHLRRQARSAEVLFLPPMACGIGVCSACALEGKRRRICACTDGPVFTLPELLP